jgi:hypothetical protein
VNALTSDAHISFSFLLSASNYPYPFPKARFCILARDLGMLDSHRSNYQRRCYRSVAKVIENVGDHSSVDFLTVKVENLL